MVTPKQGDIIWANLDPKKGHEQKGMRPLIVLSNDIVAKYTNVVIVAPISTTSRKLPLYFPVPGEYKTKGTVLLDQIVTIDYAARKFKYSETVSTEFLDTLLNVVNRIFSR